MRGLQEKNGITLIALIVTVIILLILAAVSVSMVNGSGLFRTAKNSSKKYTQAQLLEKLELAKAEYLMDNLYNNSFEGFISYLQEHSEEYGLEEIEVDGETVTLKTTGDYIYTVKNVNGEIGIEGYGQESDLPEIEVTATQYQGTYDGEGHGISVVSTTPGVTITYSTDGSTYSSELPTFTQTGGYTTYYKVRKEGYKTVSGSVTVTISRANGGITLSSSAGTFNGIESKTITVSNNTGTVTAVSEDTDIATVSVEGNEVTITSEAVSTQTAVNITITSQQSTNYEETSATYVATVKPTPVSSITISANSSTTVNQGQTEQLSVSVLPANAYDKTVIWDSDNESVATVNSSGEVSALSVGNAKITATANDGSGVYGEITITVVRVLSSISITTPPTKTSYMAGESLSISGMVVTATYSNGSTTNVTSNCTFTPSNGATLTTSNNSVIASYTEDGITKTATQSISVGSNRPSSDSNTTLGPNAYDGDLTTYETITRNNGKYLKIDSGFIGKVMNAVVEVKSDNLTIWCANSQKTKIGNGVFVYAANGSNIGSGWDRVDVPLNTVSTVQKTIPANTEYIGFDVWYSTNSRIYDIYFTNN